LEAASLRRCRGTSLNAAPPHPALCCSEFVSAELEPGAVVRKGMRHEDLQRTSFKDDTFDLILSTEVGWGRQA
jgi:hypothetical protein